MAGKVIPPSLNKRAVNNTKSPKQTTPQEVRIAFLNQSLLNQHLKKNNDKVARINKKTL